MRPGTVTGPRRVIADLRELAAQTSTPDGAQRLRDASHGVQSPRRLAEYFIVIAIDCPPRATFIFIVPSYVLSP